MAELKMEMGGLAFGRADVAEEGVVLEEDCDAEQPLAKGELHQHHEHVYEHHPAAVEH